MLEIPELHWCKKGTCQVTSTEKLLIARSLDLTAQEEPLPSRVTSHREMPFYDKTATSWTKYKLTGESEALEARPAP